NRGEGVALFAEFPRDLRRTGGNSGKSLDDGQTTLSIRYTPSLTFYIADERFYLFWSLEVPADVPHRPCQRSGARQRDVVQSQPSGHQAELFGARLEMGGPDQQAALFADEDYTEINRELYAKRIISVNAHD